MKYRSEDGINSGDNIYCYSNGVLKNKLKIKDDKILYDVETEITTIKLTDMQINPVKGNYDFEHYKNIHKRIFGDIYSFAGKTRMVSISKGEPGFCNFMFVDEQMELVFNLVKNELLDDEKYKSLSKQEYIKHIAKYMIDLNIIHPFREGNGRTLREYFRLLCKKCGYILLYDKCSDAEILEADIKGFYGDDNPLLIVLEKSLIKSEEFI